MYKRLVKLGQWELIDTRKGWEIDLIKDNRLFSLRLTEGWARFMGEFTGRRLLISGPKSIVNYLSGLLWFLKKDTRWRNVFINWLSMRAIMDFILQFLVRDYKIISIRRK